MSARTKQAALAVAPVSRPRVKASFKSTSQTLESLFCIARDDLKHEELEELSTKVEMGKDMTRRLAELAMSLACLAANDEHTGVFESSDAVAELLFVFHDLADQAQGMVEVGLYAKSELDRRSTKTGGAQ